MPRKALRIGLVNEIVPRGRALARAQELAGEIAVLPVLHDELAEYRARADRRQDALVFPTSTGARLGATNVRRRILAAAVEIANEQLAQSDTEPLPDGLTPHSLRRTFASLLFAIN